MVRLPAWFVAILLLSTVAVGCTGGEPKPPAPDTAAATPAAHPLTPHFIKALEELRAMNQQGRADDFAQAEGHFQKFRTSYNQVAAAIDEKDAKLKIHIDQGIEELVHEFRKEKPRAFELDEENMKLSQLLEKGGALVGVTVPAELVLRQPQGEIPFKQEQTIQVELDDYGIEPKRIEVPVDTKLTLKIRNVGQHVHELAVDHYALEVEDIQPGATAELTFVTLDKGEFELACFLPGHYEAGMLAEFGVK